MSDEEPVQIDRLRYILELEPTPCWAHLSPEEYQRRIAEIVEEIEAAAARRIQETGVEPLGVEAICRQNPHQRAVKSKKSPAPLVPAASKEVRRRFRDGYRLFVEAYRHAAARLRAGDRTVRSPRAVFLFGSLSCGTMPPCRSAAPAGQWHLDDVSRRDRRTEPSPPSKSATVHEAALAAA